MSDRVDNDDNELIPLGSELRPEIRIEIGHDVATLLGTVAHPRLAGTSLVVAEVVHACHEKAIDSGLEKLAVPELTRETLEPILTYCAELRCQLDQVSCPGCKRRTEALGIETLEDFIARHKEIIVGDGAVRLVGQGDAVARTGALAELEKTWSGENYWFWARRVLRKLRHGLRRANAVGSAVGAPGETPSVILMEPQLADNIGMVARAMANFGLDDMRLVAPRDGWPNEKARIAASGANYIIDDATAYATLDASVGDLNYVVATTARQRPLKKPVLTPEDAIAELRRRIARGERCGILFGRERNGLETSELAHADALVMIPVNPQFASLNLAQAVLLLGYGWMRESGQATLGRVTTYETPKKEGINFGKDRPATKEELIGLFQHLEAELDRAGFFTPIERRPASIQNLRTIFTRLEASEQEIRTLRGIVATLVGGKGDGRKR